MGGARAYSTFRQRVTTPCLHNAPSGGSTSLRHEGEFIKHPPRLFDLHMHTDT